MAEATPHAPLLRLAPAVLLLPFLGLLFSTAPAQDRLKNAPGYARYERMNKEIANAVRGGRLSVSWSKDGSSFDYRKDGTNFHYDMGTRTLSVATNTPEKITESSTNQPAPPRRNRRRPPAPGRGRQFTSAVSPDGKWKAFYRDHNLWLSEANGENERAITSDGNSSNRVFYGTANWVYGEELRQSTAMWWSSNSQQLAFYRFDESQVPDYYLALNQTNIQDRLLTEPYSKAGGVNPTVDLLVYDLASKSTVKLDVRGGRPCANSVVGHYVYGISWSPRGNELLFHRTDRLQKIFELCAADPKTGKCRVLVHESWPPSWTENSPEMRFLNDRQRFIWCSERTGFKNYYLYDLDHGLVCPLTHHPFEVAGIAHVDEQQGRFYYNARSGDNPMKEQLHSANLDGTDDRRLTDPAFHHTVDFAPDGRHFIDVIETHDQPPATRLMDSGGHLITTLAESDASKFHQLRLRPVELFEFKAADGKTTLYGMLHFPSNFSPRKRYPLLLSVYAGPDTSGARETFTLPNVITELGFLVATLDSRSAGGRGKRFLDAIYQNLGNVEIDDQAAGVRALCARPYVDPKRVGVFGTSYGGTASLLCLLRYPGLFQAACASSPVTDFRNYDTIYTERYLGLPQDNPDVYDHVSALTKVERLKGRLMLYYGTADDNVHPSNALQLVHALQRAGKSFELQAGPDAGHSSLNRDRMMEFFVEASGKAP